MEYHEWCDQLSRLLPIQISQPMPKVNEFFIDIKKHRIFFHFSVS